MTRLFAVTMPKWGMEMREGTLGQWLAAPGDVLIAGAPLLEIETDKIANALETPRGGTLRRTVAISGSIQPVGALLAVLSDADGDVEESEIDQFVASFTPAPLERSAAYEPSGVAVSSLKMVSLTQVAASPVLQQHAQRLGVDLTKITGSGRNGRITRDDIEGAARAGAISSAGALGGVRRPLTTMRAAIARRVSQSQREVPQFHVARNVRVDRLWDARRRCAQEEGRAPAIDSLLARALALALRDVPSLNVHFVDGQIVSFKHSHINIAIAGPAGLYMPLLRDADTASIASLDQAFNRAAEQCRTGQTAGLDLETGMASLSNLGAHGILDFDALINPPQALILAIGMAHETPSPATEGIIWHKTIVARATCDHRVADGVDGARLLAQFAAIVDSPETLFS